MNIYIVSFVISLYYFVWRLLEVKYIKKEQVHVRTFIKDTFVVYISSVAGCLSLSHFGDLLGFSSNEHIPVFVKEPDF